MSGSIYQGNSCKVLSLKELTFLKNETSSSIIIKSGLFEEVTLKQGRGEDGRRMCQAGGMTTPKIRQSFMCLSNSKKVSECHQVTGHGSVRWARPDPECNALQDLL